MASDDKEQPQLLAPASLKEKLRYGENPHQQANVYRDDNHATGLAHSKLLNGKPLSYNNLADANAAWLTALDFDQPVCVVLKHSQPCGVAVGRGNWNGKGSWKRNWKDLGTLDTDQLNSCERAFATDNESSFGGIVAFNTPVNTTTAKFLKSKFLEVVIAPAFDEQALTVLSTKKNLRVLQCTAEDDSGKEKQIKRISGGYLQQDYDGYLPSEQTLEWPTKERLSDASDLLFAWRVVKHCYSNAIIIAKDGQTLGIGAGQTSRVFSVRIALLRAQDNGFDIKGAVVASDAFFPFPDSIELLAKAGIKAVIQPGGSKKDPEVIAAADDKQIAMAFTSHRSFYHG